MASSDIVQIADCKLSQQLEDKQFPMANAVGSLALVKVAETHSLRLICGSAAFELKADSPLKNYPDSANVYTFSPPLAGTELLAQGTDQIAIRLELPAAVLVAGSVEAAQKKAFDDLLLEYKLLLQGPFASVDSFSRSMAMAATAFGQTVASKTQAHIDSTPAKDLGTASPAAHTVADSAEKATQAAAHYSQVAAENIQQAVAVAGRRLSAALVEFKTDMQEEFPALRSKAPTAPKGDMQKTAEQVFSSISTMATSIGSGIKDAYEATAHSVQKLVEHEAGPDAAKLSDKVGQSNRNLGQAAANTFSATSAVVQGKNFADNASAPTEGSSKDMA